MNAAVQPLADDAWPTRSIDGLASWVEQRPETLVIPITEFRRSDDGVLEGYESGIPFRTIVSAEACGMGIIEELADPRADGAATDASEGVALRRDFRFLTFDDPVRRDPADAAYDMTFGTSLTLYLPQRQPPRGLIIASGGGTEWDTALRRRFLRAGWAWLHEWAILNGENKRPATITWEPGETVDSAAARVAESVDQRLADGAYAVEGAIAFLESRDRAPWIADSPLVMMGFSRGALHLPAAAARLSDRVDAMVLVTGGANLCRIALETGWADQDYLRVQRLGHDDKPRRLTRNERESLYERYLQHTRLDPCAVSGALRATPVLLLHGWFDQVVPASTGNLLYERLGRPHRWTYPLGHGGVFWMLQHEADDIQRWVEEHVRSLADEAQPSSASTS